MAEKKYSGVRESKPGRLNDLGDNSKKIVVRAFNASRLTAWQRLCRLKMQFLYPIRLRAVWDVP